MSLRSCLTCGCCLCLTLLLIRSTNGQITTKRIADEDLPDGPGAKGQRIRTH